MIQVTKLDGNKLCINHQNIQWIENLPNTAITFITGARIIVKESVEDIISLIRIFNENIKND